MTTRTTLGGVSAAQDSWLDNLSGGDACTRWALDEARPFLGKRVLEVGCGTGTDTVPPGEQVRLFKRLIPALRRLDKALRHVVALSLFAVSRVPSARPG